MSWNIMDLSTRGWADGPPFEKANQNSTGNWGPGEPKQYQNALLNVQLKEVSYVSTSFLPSGND